MPRSYSRATLIAEIRKSTTRKSRTTTSDQSRGHELDPTPGHAARRRASTRARRSRRGPARPAAAARRRPAARARARRGRRPGRRARASPTSPTIVCGPTVTGLRRTCTAFVSANTQIRPSADGDRDDQRRVHVVVGRGRVVEEHQRADDEADQPRDGERAVGHDVRVDHEQRDAEQEQREAGPADRQHREAEERRAAATTAPSAPGRTTPGWKISKPIPAMPGEEEQRDQVRVDQRVQQAREEARARPRRSARRRCGGRSACRPSCGRRSCSAAPAASARARR